MNGVWLAIALTTFAGLATGIGSVIAFAASRTNFRFLSVATGFSAGVMLYVSFVEILAKGAGSLTEVYGDRGGMWINVGSFFGGMLLIGIIDNLIPSRENPHEIHAEIEMAVLRQPDPPADTAELWASGLACPVAPAGATWPAERPATAPADTPGVHDHALASRKLLRMGMFTALAIGIHNFPEGLATFLAVLEDPGLGLAIAIAIALHNIPEGISVAVPIYYATGKRRKAFVYSLLSGLAEPVGAVIAYLLLRTFLGGESGSFPPQVTGILFALVAGIMVYISLDELLPTSRAYGKGHDSLFGLVAGMAVMAISLLLLA